MNRQCDNCRHYGESGGGEPGFCLWAKALPPVMVQMLLAQEAEPAAHIRHTVFDGMEISMPPDGYCSAHSFEDPN